MTGGAVRGTGANPQYYLNADGHYINPGSISTPTTAEVILCNQVIDVKPHSNNLPLFAGYDITFRGLVQISNTGTDRIRIYVNGAVQENVNLAHSGMVQLGYGTRDQPVKQGDTFKVTIQKGVGGGDASVQGWFRLAGVDITPNLGGKQAVTVAVSMVSEASPTDNRYTLQFEPWHMLLDAIISDGLVHTTTGPITDAKTTDNGGAAIATTNAFWQTEMIHIAVELAT